MENGVDLKAQLGLDTTDFQREIDVAMRGFNAFATGVESTARGLAKTLGLVTDGADLLDREMRELTRAMQDLERDHSELTRESQRLQRELIGAGNAADRAGAEMVELAGGLKRSEQTASQLAVSNQRAAASVLELADQADQASRVAARLSTAMGDTERRTEAATAANRAHAGALDDVGDSARQLIADLKAQNRALEDQKEALERLARETNAERQALILSANNTKKLTREQLAHIRITREGIGATSEYGRSLIASSRSLDLLESELKSANKDLGLFRVLASDAGQSLASMASFAAVAAASMVAVRELTQEMQRAITTQATFEQAVADLSAITGLAGESLRNMADEAKALGSSTQFSASQAAEAFKLIASAKAELAANPEELAAVTKEVLLLAQAASIELASSAIYVTESLNQFGLGADETSRVVNVMAAASKAGAASVTDLGETFKNSGPAAARAKVSYEELAAATETVAQSGLKGSEAGTHLRIVLNKLDQHINRRYRPSVVGLEKALENLNDAQLTSAQLGKIFGEDAATTAGYLIDNVAAFTAYTTAVTGTTTAQDQAAIQTNTLNAEFKALGSAIEGLRIEIGELANAPLRDATQEATGFISNLSTVIDALNGDLESAGDASRNAAAGIEEASESVGLLDVLIESTGLYQLGAIFSGTASDVEEMADRLATTIKVGRGLRETILGLTKKTVESTNAVQSDTDARQINNVAIEAARDALIKSSNALQLQIDHYGEAAEVIAARILLAQQETEVSAEQQANYLKEAARAAGLKKALAELKKAEKEQADAKKAKRKAEEEEHKLLQELTRDYNAWEDALIASEYGLRDLTEVEKTSIEIRRQNIAATGLIGQLMLANAAHMDEQIQKQKKLNAERAADALMDAERAHWAQLTDAIGLTQRELDKLATQQRVGKDLTQQQADAIKVLVDAYHDEADAASAAARATELYADVANAALDTVFQAGLDVWDGQIDSFDGFKDTVLDGLEEILQKLLVVSATQWILPESMGGSGGAFSGFGGTDLGQLLAGGKSLLANSNIGGSLMSSQSGLSIGAYAGPALAALTVGGTALAAIDSLSDGGLFGTSWDVLARTVELSVENGILTGFERVERTRERSLFRGTQTETVETALPAEMESVLQGVYTYINNVLIQGAGALGLEAGQTLRESLGDEFSVGVIAGEDYLGAISRHLVRMGERLAVEVAPGIELVTRSSESMIDALARVADTSVSVNGFLDGFGVSLDNLISPDLIAQTIGDYSQYLIGQISQSTVNNARTGDFDPLGVDVTVDDQGRISDETLAGIAEAAAALAAQLNLTAEEIQATILDGATALEAARLVFLNELEELAGGNEALTAQLTEFAGYWSTATDDAEKAIEAAIGGLGPDITDALDSLNTSTETFLADYNAAISGALSPEDLLAWVDLGNQIGRLFELERELARLRGEALDFGTLTAEQQRQVATETAALNDVLAGLGSNAVVSNQGLLDLTNTLGDIAGIADFVTQVYREFTPEADRIAAEMATLTDAAATLGLDLSGSADSIRAEYQRLLNEALTAGDGDTVNLIRSIFGSLSGYLEDLDEQAAALAQEQADAAQAAVDAAAALAALNDDLSGLGIGLEYASGQLQAVADELGGLDRVNEQWQLVLREFFTPIERAEFDLARTGDLIAGAGIDLAELSERGLAYYRDQLLSANELKDASREAQLLDLADEVLAFVQATETLGEAGAESRRELEQLTETISGITSGIDAQIAQVNATGLIPTSDLDQLTGRIGQVRDLIADTDGIQERISLNQELANLVTQRFSLERDAILENARLRLDEENRLITERNELNREAYQTALARHRELQRLGETAGTYEDRIAGTGLAPVVQFDDAQGDFRAILESIMSGESTDGGALTGSADQYLDLAQQLFGATPQFYAILGEVQSALGQVQNLAASSEEPVEPPEIALMTDISQSSNIMAQAQRELESRQIETTNALGAINDELTKLLKEQAEQEQAHRELQADHFATVQEQNDGTKKAIETAAEQAERFARENNESLKSLEHNVVGIGGSVDDLLALLHSGGIELSDRIFDVMNAQLGAQLEMAARLAGIESAMNYLSLQVGALDLAVTVNTTCNCGGGGEPGDGEHDVETEEIEREYA